jgi:hypothetical protein
MQFNGYGIHYLFSKINSCSTLVLFKLFVNLTPTLSSAIKRSRLERGTGR